MRWKCSSSQQPAFSAQYERSWRVLPVSGGVPVAVFERARLFCERAGIEPARVRVCRLSALPSFYAASMSPGGFSSSHVSSFRFTLIPPKTDLSSLSTFMTTTRIGCCAAGCWLLRHFQRIKNDSGAPKGKNRLLMRWPQGSDFCPLPQLG